MGEAEDRLFPETLKVQGAEERALNQKYKRVLADELKSFPKVLQKMRGCERWAYLGEEEIEGCKPYLWQQNGEWKLSVMGETSSLYVCPDVSIRFGRWSRHGLQDWMRYDTGELFPDLKLIYGGDGINTDGADDELDYGAGGPEIAIYPGGSLLSPSDMEELYDKGYTVLAPTGAFGEAVRNAFRLSQMLVAGMANMLLGHQNSWVEPYLDSSSLGCGNVRIKLAKAEPFQEILSMLLPLVKQLLQEDVEIPNCVQLAILPPDGDPAEKDYLGRADSRGKFSYHVDGRGNLQNNIGVLLGIALSAPPADTKCWGAFTCHPASHRNKELHNQYTAQYLGVIPKLDLGESVPVLLQQGEIMVAHPLLAHRRSQNWSGNTRYNLYFRLRPKSAAQNPGWQDRVLDDPFSIWPGLTWSKQSQRGEAGKRASGGRGQPKRKLRRRNGALR
ncbi:unnamed protein product [Cladocopium goreaui]|uniref:Phytanoyl-CoA dioxygenase n=1 Tax=Cladocopium goreaui TaxID=2562237 RepID=A0A9P1FKZ1_9DINO|nr:unnamed protein product [Cladocopium goreaui]